jgi:hypothetical protein
MKPPFFLRKSGTLDVFDTVEELENRYPPDTLTGEDFIACDSEGRILLAGSASDGLTVQVCDEQQAPSPDTLRNLLRGYLERSGISPEEIDSLSLEDLIARAYPNDPVPTEKINAFLLHQRCSYYVRSQLRDIHSPSWIAGYVVALWLMYFGTPHILAAYCQPIYFYLANLLRVVEPLAIVVSTIYVIERFIRWTAHWHFSLKELLTVVTALSLATSVIALQSRYAQLIKEITLEEFYVKYEYRALLYKLSVSDQQAGDMDEIAKHRDFAFVADHEPPDIPDVVLYYYPSYPLLDGELWLFQLPLVFGVACLAYVFVMWIFWTVHKVTWSLCESKR